MSDEQTLRDTFAAAALTGVLAGRLDRVEESHADVWAHMAGTLADAMLRERAATNHDAAPAATATSAEAVVPQTDSASDRSGNPTSHGGTGDTTREPVAWGVLPGDGLPLWRCSSRGQAQAVCIWLREQRPGTDPHVVPLVDGRDPPPPTLTEAEVAFLKLHRERLVWWAHSSKESAAELETVNGLLARLGGEP